MFAFTGLHKKNGAEIRNPSRLAPYLQVLMPLVAQEWAMLWRVSGKDFSVGSVPWRWNGEKVLG